MPNCKKCGTYYSLAKEECPECGEPKRESLSVKLNRSTQRIDGKVDEIRARTEEKLDRLRGVSGAEEKPATRPVQRPATPEPPIARHLSGSTSEQVAGAVADLSDLSPTIFDKAFEYAVEKFPISYAAHWNTVLDSFEEDASFLPPEGNVPMEVIFSIDKSCQRFGLFGASHLRVPEDERDEMLLLHIMPLELCDPVKRFPRTNTAWVHVGENTFRRCVVHPISKLDVAARIKDERKQLRGFKTDDPELEDRYKEYELVLSRAISKILLMDTMEHFLVVGVRVPKSVQEEEKEEELYGNEEITERLFLEKPLPAGLLLQRAQPLQFRPSDLSARIDWSWTEAALYPALAQAGYPLIDRVTARSGKKKLLGNLRLQTEWAPDVWGGKTESTLDDPTVKGTASWEYPQLALDTDRLRRVKETEKATLVLRLQSAEKEGWRSLWSRSVPVEIKPYNELVVHPELLDIMAAFVMPNDPYISNLISDARPYLEKLAGNTLFCGYQAGPEHVHAMVNALYDLLADRITYNNPPASFEGTGQKIRLPREVVESQRGTCLDLALLYAAMIEHVGVNPLIVLVPGHAFPGYWVEDGRDLKAPICQNKDLVMEERKEHRLRFLNSTTFTMKGDFDQCRAEGDSYMKGEILGVLDIKMARRMGGYEGKGVKPLTV
jgi:hypothetical protein